MKTNEHEDTKSLTYTHGQLSPVIEMLARMLKLYARVQPLKQSINIIKSINTSIPEKGTERLINVAREPRV